LKWYILKHIDGFCKRPKKKTGCIEKVTERPSGVYAAQHCKQRVKSSPATAWIKYVIIEVIAQ